jgi:hypothetical protein
LPIDGSICSGSSIIEKVDTISDLGGFGSGLGDDGTPRTGARGALVGVAGGLRWQARLTATFADALLRAIGVDVMDKRLEALQAVLLGTRPSVLMSCGTRKGRNDGGRGLPG